MKQEFIDELTDIFDLEEPVNMEDEFRKFESWSSLVYLSIIAMIDENYDIIIPREDFLEMKTIGDIYSYVVSKLEVQSD